jgi:hypothetical protein
MTALVAVGCLVGPPIVREVRARFFQPPLPAGYWKTSTINYYTPSGRFYTRVRGTEADETGTDVQEPGID